MTATTNYTRSLLKRIPGLEIVEMEGASDCCGLAGPWGLGEHYDMTLKLRQTKIKTSRIQKRTSSQAGASAA